MSEIWIRHRYVTDPPYTASCAAWATRPPPACDGPRPTTIIKAGWNDKELDTVLLRAWKAFGDPLGVPMLGAVRVKKPELVKPPRKRR